MDNVFLQQCYNEVESVFQELAAKGLGTFDRIAKSPTLTKALQDRLSDQAHNTTNLETQSELLETEEE